MKTWGSALADTIIFTSFSYPIITQATSIAARYAKKDESEIVSHQPPLIRIARACNNCTISDNHSSLYFPCGCLQGYYRIAETRINPSLFPLPFCSEFMLLLLKPALHAVGRKSTLAFQKDSCRPQVTRKKYFHFRFSHLWYAQNLVMNQTFKLPSVPT